MPPLTVIVIAPTGPGVASSDLLHQCSSCAGSSYFAWDFMEEHNGAGMGFIFIPLSVIALVLFLWWQSAPPRPVQPLPPAASSSSQPPLSTPPVQSASCLYDDFIIRAADAVDSNEGSGGFVKINWDDAGYGISVGKMQWNQVAGGLPGLLRRFHDANPQRFREIFGTYADSLLDENYVRYQASFTPDNDLGKRMLQALAEPSFQEVQSQMMRERIIWAVELSKRYGHSSELFVVEVADIGNQTGNTGVENSLRSSGVAQIIDETQAIEALQAHAPRPGGERRDAHLEAQFSPDRHVADVC